MRNERRKRRSSRNGARVYTETDPIISPQEIKIISDALQSIPTKKQNLRTALSNLQSHSSSLSPSTINLQWSEFDSHYTSLQTSLQTRFQQLISKQPLESFCTQMDGIGLRNCILARGPEMTSPCEITMALESAPDPGKLVVDALDPAFLEKIVKGETSLNGRACVLLLQGVSNIQLEVKEEAKKLAVELKDKVSLTVYLEMLGTYGLQEEFDVDELLDLLVCVARMPNAVELCRHLGFASKVPDLLKAYEKEVKKVVKEILDKDNNSPNSQESADRRELRLLILMIKCINDFNLDYP